MALNALLRLTFRAYLEQAFNPGDPTKGRTRKTQQQRLWSGYSIPASRQTPHEKVMCLVWEGGGTTPSADGLWLPNFHDIHKPKGLWTPYI